MRYPTYLELKRRIERELDLESEDFIQPEELIGYFNEAIDFVEAEIHKLYEDYFLTYANLALVNGTSEYALPSGIYATMIRGITYRNGSTIFTIHRLPETNKFENVEYENYNTVSNPIYRYLVVNNSAANGERLMLVPTSQETSATNVKLWFIRNANRIDDADLTAADATIIDIPEFIDFVMQHAKVRCYEKEGHPNLAIAKSDLEMFKKQMAETLTNRTPDAENKIEMDYTHYEEMN